MEKLKFEANVPVTLALKFATPREFESQFHDGKEYQYSTCDGKVFFATAALHQRIEGLGVSPREEFTICKRQDGRATAWEVGRQTSTTAAPQSRADCDLHAAEPITRDTSRGPRVSMDRAVRMFLEVAARKVLEVEQIVGRPVDQVVQALACTMFIESARKGIIEFPAELAQSMIADQKLGELQRKPAASETSPAESVAPSFPAVTEAFRTREDLKAATAKLRETLGEVEYFERLAQFHVSDFGQFRHRRDAEICYELLVGAAVESRRAA